MATGYLGILLHAHLPFVRHPENARHLEEDWLFEAITETYIPLLDVFNRLDSEGVHFRLAMSITPPLAEMLADPLLQARYVEHLDRLIALSSKELARTQFVPQFHDLARMYHDKFTWCKRFFDEWYGRDLLSGFRHYSGYGAPGNRHLQRNARIPSRVARESAERDRPTEAGRTFAQAPFRAQSERHLACRVRLLRRPRRRTRPRGHRLLLHRHPRHPFSVRPRRASVSTLR